MLACNDDVSDNSPGSAALSKPSVRKQAEALAAAQAESTDLRYNRIEASMAVQRVRRPSLAESAEVQSAVIARCAALRGSVLNNASGHERFQRRTRQPGSGTHSECLTDSSGSFPSHSPRRTAGMREQLDSLDALLRANQRERRSSDTSITSHSSCSSNDSPTNAPLDPSSVAGHPRRREDVLPSILPPLSQGDAASGQQTRPVSRPRGARQLAPPGTLTASSLCNVRRRLVEAASSSKRASQSGTARPLGLSATLGVVPGPTGERRRSRGLGVGLGVM